MKAEHEYKNYKYSSSFAKYIIDYIDYKRKSTDSHCNTQAWRLYQFDSYVIDTNFNTEIITKECIAWYFETLQKMNLSSSSINGRMSTLRDFTIYLNSHGFVSAIVPEKYSISTKHREPYIPKDDEIKVFLDYTNQKICKIPVQERGLYLCYGVMFRLFLMCGLRLSEAIDLLRDEVKFDEEILYIRHSKGDKSRIVPFSNQLKIILKNCDIFLDKSFPNRKYFFVNLKGNRILKSNMDTWLSKIWKECFGDNGKNFRPSISDLRHTFIVRRIDEWGGEQCNEFKSKLPLLSKYVGHSSVEHTMYYYHRFREQSSAAEKVILDNNSVSCELKNEIFK